MKLSALTFFTFCSFIIWGQKKINLSFDSDSYQHVKKNIQSSFDDSLALSNYLNSFIDLSQKRGYILSSIDSLSVIDSTQYIAHFYLGPNLQEIVLNIDIDEEAFIRKESTYSEKLLARTRLSPNEFNRTLNGLKKAYLNNGYPFVEIHLENIKLDQQPITADLKIDKGPFLKWKEVHIKGDSTISKKYLTNLINISIGDTYNEAIFNTIPQRIKQVNFIKQLRAPEILYTPEGAELYVYVNSVPLSSANGIIGLQPNPESNKTIVTGEINLKLLNILKRGEQFNLQWRSIQPQTQSLKSLLSIPFLFNTPFGVEGKFDLFKRDSTFLELNSNVGINYFLNGGSYIKAFYQNVSSNLLSAGVSSTEGLASVNSHNYGLAYFRNRVDYIPNPRKGINISLSSSAGSRNARIGDTNQVVKSTIYRGEISVEAFIPLYKRNVLRLASNSSYYVAPEIYQNELYRFGGLTSQRGFNEEILRASTLTTFTIEYRYLLDQNSHAFVFFDQTWYEQNAGIYFNDSPYGFGLGFSFGTNIGIFSISYALGKEFDNPILLRNGKIHFGYIAYF